MWRCCKITSWSSSSRPLTWRGRARWWRPSWQWSSGVHPTIRGSPWGKPTPKSRSLMSCSTSRLVTWLILSPSCAWGRTSSRRSRRSQRVCAKRFSISDYNQIQNSLNNSNLNWVSYVPSINGNLVRKRRSRTRITQSWAMSAHSTTLKCSAPRAV